jgi:cardiolipin synthase A/B
MVNTAFQEGHDIHLLQGGEQYFAALIQAVDAAQEEVRLESYIFDFTGRGAAVASHLIAAASRGVRVHLLYPRSGRIASMPPACNGGCTTHSDGSAS